jgi:hypothetical protein
MSTFISNAAMQYQTIWSLKCLILEAMNVLMAAINCSLVSCWPTNLMLLYINHRPSGTPCKANASQKESSSSAIG